MKEFLISIAVILCSNLVSGQQYKEKFEHLRAQNDTLQVIQLLAEWEKAAPNDPEFYVSATNFYFARARIETISLTPGQTGTQSIPLTDSTGKPAGYMNSSVDYKPDQVLLALGYLDKGIARFPTRLDMRFGKCYELQKISDYDDFTSEVIKTVEYSGQIDNKWLWMNNAALDSGEQALLETIQDYMREMYDTEIDSLLGNMKQIGEATLKLYPNCIPILSSTAVANLLTKNYDTALAYLKRAEKLNPTDFIVLNNIAQAYKMMGDKAGAIKYYQLTEKYGDDEAKRQAQENIKALQN